RDGGEQRDGEPREVRAHVRSVEPGTQETDAAVDVEADAARRDHALVRVDGGDAADGEAVAPVEVGHGERVADDAGQVRDVHHLRERGVVAQLAHELIAGVDAPGHAHAAVPGDLPYLVVDA